MLKELGKKGLADIIKVGLKEYHGENAIVDRGDKLL
jgi:hypothetical protein